MGQLATLPTCAPDSQARLHRAGSVPCKPKTLKMSAYGTFSPTARPPGVLPTPWALPTPAFATWQGVQGKTSCTLTTEALGRLQPVKAKPLRGCFASLDGFPAPSASVSFATPRRWRGVQGDEVVHFTLDALESTQHTHRRGRWIGFATCPCSQVRVGFGAKPGACFLFLKLLGWM